MANTSVNRSTPGPLPFSPRLKTLCFALMFIGVITFAITLTRNPDRAWHAYLTAYFYFALIGIGGLFFTAIQYMTSAGWSVNIRRYCEATTAYLPVAAVGAIGVVLGGSHLYELMNKAKVVEDELLAHKSSYLNPTFFVV